MMAVTNLTSYFSNGSSVKDNATCDILDNSFPVKITKVVLFSIILVTSLAGNTLIIIIVYKKQELRKTTNYFIVNMAVSDFVYPLLAIPFTMAQIVSGSPYWPIQGTEGLIFCKLGVYLRRVSAAVSGQSLVWIALDRFIAVVLPLKIHLISSRLRVFAIAFTWIVATTIHFIELYVYELVEENHGLLCTVSIDARSLYRTYGLVRLPLYIAPKIAMTILYCLIILTLRRQDKVLRCAEKHQLVQRKRRAVKMSLCIMIANYICSLPLFFVNVLWEYQKEMQCSLVRELSCFAYLLFFSSSTMNPIICMTFAKNYRSGLKQICQSFWCHCSSKRNWKMEAGQHEQITLQNIQAISRPRENTA